MRQTIFLYWVEILFCKVLRIHEKLTIYTSRKEKQKSDQTSKNVRSTLSVSHEYLLPKGNDRMILIHKRKRTSRRSDQPDVTSFKPTTYKKTWQYCVYKVGFDKNDDLLSQWCNFVDMINLYHKYEWSSNYELSSKLWVLIKW